MSQVEKVRVNDQKTEEWIPFTVAASDLGSWHYARWLVTSLFFHYVWRGKMSVVEKRKQDLQSDYDHFLKLSQH